MSGVGGQREGSRYRRAASNTPSQGNPWDGNKMEKDENTQKLTTSEGEQSSQASVYQQEQEQYVDSYVVITPNEARRKQLQQIAQKELDDLERWKEKHRAGPIALVPQKLGGKESEAQVRENQQMMLMQSKYQKKHKREEYVKAKKAAEEAEILKKKAIQREKAERLEVKKRQEEMKRREMFLQDQMSKTSELLSRLDVGLPKSDSCQIANPGPESTAWKRSHAYKQALREDENRRLEEMKQEQWRKAELMEFKQKQQEEARTRAHQNEQRSSRTKRDLITSNNLDILNYLNNGFLESNYLERRTRKGIAEIFTFIWPRPNDLIKAPRNRSFIIVIFFLP